jgi:hypothetical protein
MAACLLGFLVHGNQLSVSSTATRWVVVSDLNRVWVAREHAALHFGRRSGNGDCGNNQEDMCGIARGVGGQWGYSGQVSGGFGGGGGSGRFKPDFTHFFAARVLFDCSK